MIRARMWCAVLLCGGLAASSAPRAQASVVQALSLEALTQKAEVIVVGTPTAQKSRPHHHAKLIMTDVVLKVEEVLKGDAQKGQNLTATLLGGQIEDDVAVSVPGEATLPIGQRVVLFLYRAPMSGDLRVVGMSQGALPLVEKAGKTMVLPGGSDASLVEQGSDGVLRDAPAALLEPALLSDLLIRIRKLVRAK